MYSPNAMDHFLKPRNSGVLAHPDGRGAAVNDACGDRVEITVQVVNGRLEQVRFASQACAGGIAACSALTEWATGKTPKEAAEATAAELAELLGGLPDAKLGCAEMAVSALHDAVRGLNP